MRITIIGGSKGTGAELAALARNAGHDVIVVSRSSNAHDGVRTVTGDAADPAVLQQAIDDADAVVVTVGAAKGIAHHRTKVTRAVIARMQQVGVRRILIQSSLGAGDSAAQLPAAFRFITKVALAKPLADHNEQEAAVQASGLDWTIVRPAGLTDKEPHGDWLATESAADGTLRGTIPRRDLAACMLQVLQDASTIGKALGVSSR